MLEMPLPSDTPKEFEMTCEMKEVKSLGVGSDSDFNVSDWLGRFNATPTRGCRQLTTDGTCPRVEEYAAQNYCISDYGVR
jgi:hypothetical protein